MNDALTFDTLCQAVETFHDGRMLSVREAADAALDAASKDLAQFGGTAAIKLTLALKATGGDVLIVAKIEATTPKAAILPTRLYLSQKGTLHLENLRQQALPFPQDATGGRK